jgi:hypothetical protein
MRFLPSSRPVRLDARAKRGKIAKKYPWIPRNHHGFERLETNGKRFPTWSCGGITGRNSGADHRRLANEVSSGGASGYTIRPESGLMYTRGARISEIATFRDRPTSCEYAKRGSVRTRHRSGYSPTMAINPTLTNGGINPIVVLVANCARTEGANCRRASTVGSTKLYPSLLERPAIRTYPRGDHTAGGTWRVPATTRRLARVCGVDHWADGTAECACYYQAIRSRGGRHSGVGLLLSGDSLARRTAQRCVPATIRRFARAADGTAVCACYDPAIRSRGIDHTLKPRRPGVLTCECELTKNR